jgi:hypothetical protein
MQALATSSERLPAGEQLVEGENYVGELDRLYCGGFDGEGYLQTHKERKVSVRWSGWATRAERLGDTHPSCLSRLESDLGDRLDLEAVQMFLLCVFARQDSLNGHISQAEWRVKRVVGDELDHEGLWRRVTSDEIGIEPSHQRGSRLIVHGERRGNIPPTDMMFSGPEYMSSRGLARDDSLAE